VDLPCTTLNVLSKALKALKGGSLPTPSVKLEPVKELVIKELLFFKSVEELARFANIAAGGRPSALYWADGVAFLYYPLPLTAKITATELVREGRLYWAMVCFALMPEYERVVETREKLMVPVIDVSSCSLFRAVASTLKEKAGELTTSNQNQSQS